MTQPRLAELNSYVPIKVLEGSGEITPEMVAPYQVRCRVLSWLAMLIQRLWFSPTQLQRSRSRLTSSVTQKGSTLSQQMFAVCLGQSFALCGP